MTIKIREAKPEDARAIAKMYIASWRDAYAGIIDKAWLDSRDFEEGEQRWVENLNKTSERQEKTYLAFVGNDLAAFATAGQSRNEDFDSYAELWAIYAHPDFYGRGAGKAVFNAAAAHVRELGLSKMFVNVLRDNPRGRNFYERMGALLISESESEITLGDNEYIEVKYEWKELRL